MNLASLPFIAFVAALLFLFNAVPARFRWVVLLCGSYLFYASFRVPYLLLALMAVTVISYACGLLLLRSKEPGARLFWMWGGVLGNLSILFWLKYLPFAADNVNAALDAFSLSFRLPALQVLMALGVSYYVFQGISYLIDIYLEVIEPERHPGFFSLSLAFFPKLLQGPIERSGNLLPQLHGLSRSSLSSLRLGANLFLWGAFKKVVIADRLATFVDPVYGSVHQFHGVAVVIATYLFALQLYFDFSGYTDMALGAGRLFNVRLTQNFNAPYLATSVADFWRRWHISFSSWILDYIFKPLQFSLRDWPRWGVPAALLATFLFSGIWHGASWCFVAWGGIHGLYLAAGVLFKKGRVRLCKRLGVEKSPLLKYWQRFVTFHLVCFSWIFFRARSLDDALYVSASSVLDLPAGLARLAEGGGLAEQLAPGRSAAELLFTLALAGAVALLGRLELQARKKDPAREELSFLHGIPFWGSAIAYGAIFYLITICGLSAKGFLYQQF